MSSLIRRIRRFISSPEGRRAIDQAKRAARDPRNQAKAKRALRRLRGRH